MKSNISVHWYDSISITYKQYVEQFISFAPTLLGALAILLVGVVFGLVLKHAARKIVKLLGVIFLKKSSSDHLSSKMVVLTTSANVLSFIAFWAVMLFFIASAANYIGWKVLQELIRTFLSYIPNLALSFFIIFTCFILADRVGIIISSLYRSVSHRENELLSKTAQVIIVFTGIILGIENLGIQMKFLTDLIVIVVGILLSGAALAFGFGARSMIANVIGSHFVKKHCKVGDKLGIADVIGVITEINSATITLETEEGKVIMPSKIFLSEMSKLQPQFIKKTKRDAKVK
jgi:small-conductance mechanosensitive channel